MFLICYSCRDLGAHIDGFVAVCAYSFVVGASKDNKVKDRRADAILAAHNSAEAVLRKLKQEVEVSTIRKNFSFFSRLEERKAGICENFG